MKFTDIFIQRPVLATVVSLLIFIIGLKSVFNLDVRQYPKVENTVITITTTYPGANAQLMQGFITQPLQTSVASADGIDYLNSSSTQGVSTIQAHLKLNFDSSIAFTDILAKVNAVTGQLPRDANSPVITKTTGSSIALLYISYSSDKISGQQIYDVLTRIVQPKIQSVSGVASADILGGNPFAMRIWLQPDKMAALNITADDINKALTSNSYLSAAGQLKGQYTVTNIKAETDLHSEEEFNKLVVKEVNGKLIRMRDVAQVELGSENYSSSVTFNGKKGVFIGVNSVPTANPLTVVQEVRKVLPDILKSMPPSLAQVVVYDSTEFISSSIKDVIKTLAEATIIVVIVIFLFLGSIRSVIIPIVTIPLSLVGVCSIMLLLGYTINLLTLLSMVLAIGLVVDDAIVVVENIQRHIEEGKNSFQAALQGAKEIALPVITMTITLSAVYAPIGLMGGLTGALFKEFALTLAASVIVSGIIALTLSPMMCSKILRFEESNEGFAKWLDKKFNELQLFYEKRLIAVINYRPVVLIFGTLILFSVFFLFKLTPKELAPKEDQGFLLAIANAPQYANINYLEKYTEQIDGIFAKFPERAAHFIANGRNGENGAFAGFVLKPWGDRHRSAQALQPLIQKELSDISGINAFIFALPDLPTGASGFPVQMVLKSTDSYTNIYQVMEELKASAKKSGLFIVVDSDLNFETPQLNISIDKSKAADVNISMQQIGQQLATFLGGNYTNLFSMDGRSYKIIPQLSDTNRYNPSDLKKTYIKSNSGIFVPLSNFISFKMSSEPNSLNQFQQLNSATFSAVMMPGQTTSTGVDFLKKEADRIMPYGMTYDFSGDSRTEQKEGNALLLTFTFALIIIFLVLSAQFESFRDPLIIMISVPMAICGALIPLNLGLATINIYTEIGLITLIGLITKHGILMVEFANKLREENNYDIRTAIEKAASIRLRPILMTTAAMVLAVIPLIIASGAGASSRHDIGIVIASGLTIGTLFTLFIVPTMYTYLARSDEKVKHEKAKTE
ncbi:efflux RND transporter permease subunit [Fluviispira multicolorata]|uniref:MMPL family transporter n=1 Tax=Fluviispira multicolorata TaxID=2654512 RepID=A0A833N6N7_9BACT|nr:efflux RND transporter permease subunit [Fluviispira multicolorata]KAB8033730.1 MMPL family transporter [Fluviispira multicolorata]